jgi:hypothetical protein
MTMRYHVMYVCPFVLLMFDTFRGVVVILQIIMELEIDLRRGQLILTNYIYWVSGVHLIF